jgi:hypothetical protein
MSKYVDRCGGGEFHLERPQVKSFQVIREVKQREKIASANLWVSRNLATAMLQEAGIETTSISISDGIFILSGQRMITFQILILILCLLRPHLLPTVLD